MPTQNLGNRVEFYASPKDTRPIMVYELNNGIYKADGDTIPNYGWGSSGITPRNLENLARLNGWETRGKIIHQNIPNEFTETQQKPQSDLLTEKVNLRPKPKPVIPRVNIPENLLDGLAKLDNEGYTYYTFDGSAKDIANAIASLGSLAVVPPKRYNPPRLAPNNQLPSKTQQLSPVTITKDTLYKFRQVPTSSTDDDAAVEMYMYPHRTVNIYKMDPEVAALVRKNLKSNNNYHALNAYILTTSQLPYQEYNDTIVHDIRKKIRAEEAAHFMPELGLYDVMNLDRANVKYDLILSGQTLAAIDIYDNDIVKDKNKKFAHVLPIGENKVLVRNNHPEGIWLMYKLTPSKVDFDKKRVSDMGLPTYSWSKAVNLRWPKSGEQEQQPSIGEGLRNIANSFINDMGSLFRR